MMEACRIFIGVIGFVWFVLTWTASSAPAQIRTVTNDGIALDETILVRVHGVLFRIPAGYLVPWPKPAMRGQVNERDNLNFNFWMPEPRYVEIDDISIDGSRPAERGRERPGRDAYVVKVRSLQPATKLDTPGYISPEKRFQNFTSLPAPSSYSFYQEKFGLTRFWRHDWPHPQPKPFMQYRHAENTDPQVNLRCTPPHEAPPDPLCSGDVHFAGDDLGFYFRFPRSELPRWREIAEAVRALIKSWKASP